LLKVRSRFCRDKTVIYSRRATRHRVRTGYHRRPWPMIESRSHAGHRRWMILSQSLAQSVSSLCGEAESGIKRIVVHWGSPPGVDLPRSEPEAELLLLNKSNWKRIKLLGYRF
jgi:hypothetical protein